MTSTETSLDTLVRTALEERAYVWVQGPHTCFMGFILGLSDSLILIQRFQDFAEYGYAIIRRSLVTELVYGTRPLQFFQQMMKYEGVLERVGLPFPVPLHSMATAIQSINSKRVLAMFEPDPADVRDDSEWPVGEVLSTNEESTVIRMVTAWGDWEDRVRVLDTRRIPRIEFESPYLRALAKYSPRAAH